MTDYKYSVKLLQQAGAKRLGGTKHEQWELNGRIIPLSRGSKPNPFWIRRLVHLTS
jgi:hypothetical protein